MIENIETVSKFDEFIKQDKVIIDFFAEWCPPCKILAKVIDQVSVEYPSVAFAKVNIDVIHELASRYLVSNIPTVLFFKEGKLIEKSVGALPKQSFTKLLKEILF